MSFAFSKLIGLFLLAILLSSAGCQRNYQRAPSRKAKAEQPAKSKKEVEAKDKTEDSFKVGKKDQPKPQEKNSDAATDSRPTKTDKMPSGTPTDVPPAKDYDSLTADTQNHLLFKTNQAEISIAREALDKEFLLQGALIPQDKVALGRSIKSRVVAFQLKGKKVVMLEATQGHSLNADFSQKLVLATFEILSEDNDYVTFDFNAGMSQLVTLSDWYAKDFDGPDYSTEKQFAAFRVINSFIESAEINHSNQLVIRQISLLSNNGKTEEQASVRIPIEVKYYVSPYRPSKSFVPTKSPQRFDELGFFEINPQLSVTGETLNYATRFHTTRPIVFAISSNTPADYQQAVEDGILYWNKAFGKQLIKVVKAPEGVRAPDFKYNVVQWVNWDYAGSAYADGQMDPRTGEILHAQVFLTSAFAFDGKNKAREILRKLEKPSIPFSSMTMTVGLKGLEKVGWCNLDYKKSLIETLEQIVASDLSDAVVFKLSQDYIRMVVAHEIGHTLGLRHNFAGTLAATYSHQERPQLFEEYLKTGHAKSTVTYSSSVMDYLRIEEAAMIGDLTLKAKKPLAYDFKAIQKLYFNKTPEQSINPLFCTDSHADIKGFVDCKRFDFGASAVEFAKWEIENSLQSLPQTLIEKYIRHKTDLLQSTPGNAVQVPLEPTATLAANLLQSQNDLLKLLTVNRSLLAVERQFIQADERTEEQVKAVYNQFLDSEIKRVGGIASLFNLVPDQYFHTTIEKVNSLLKSPQFKSGHGYGGTNFEFSEAEIQDIQNELTAYLQKLEKSLILTELKNLKTTAFNKDTSNKDPSIKNSKFVNNELSQEFAKTLFKKALEYVTDLNDSVIESNIDRPKSVVVNSETLGVGAQTIQAKEYEKVPVKLPTFKHPLEVRILAASLFAADRGEDIAWGTDEKTELRMTFKKLLDNSVSAPFETIEPHLQDRQVQRWFLENKKVLNELGESIKKQD